MYLSINTVNLSLRLKKNIGRQKSGKTWRRLKVKFQKQLIDYYFYNGEL